MTSRKIIIAFAIISVPFAILSGNGISTTWWELAGNKTFPAEMFLFVFLPIVATIMSAGCWFVFFYFFIQHPDKENSLISETVAAISLLCAMFAFGVYAAPFSSNTSWLQVGSWMLFPVLACIPIENIRLESRHIELARRKSLNDIDTDRNCNIFYG
jgi:4-amino-4-deoxy-L-arabinose transferase-like glycosyltransferase